MRCTYCSRQPHGAEGHLDLFVLKMQGNKMQFICRTCSTLWLRIKIDENYRWAESKFELDAVTVPGSTNLPTQPPRR